MPGTLAPQRERTARVPTGLPNPPLIALVGPEKTGKSYEAALGSSTDLVGMTYWIPIGGTESTADYYGRIKGARYRIVNHNGSYQDILDAIRWAIAQTPVDGKRNMIVLDSVTALWDLLSDEQALYARRRAERKAAENRRRAPGLDDPVVVDADLWNRAKDRWGEVLWTLRQHSGPTILIARQEVVTAFENDRPTRHTTRKIKAERNLPAAVDAIVELHSLGQAHLTGVRTLHWDIKPGETIPFPDFSVDSLLRRLGYEDAAATRSTAEVRPDAYLEEQAPSAQAPTQHQSQEPELSAAQAATLIRKAVADETNPEACLHGIREEWGIRTLTKVMVDSNWGRMTADDLISRSLAYVKKRATEQAEQAKAPTGGTGVPAEQGAQQLASRTDEPAVTRPAPALAEHTAAGPPPPAAAEPEPPAAASSPPPPDPLAEPQPPEEDRTEVSAAEEPQVLPLVQRRRTRNEEFAFKALMDEATAQARFLFLTVGEHLAEISEDGEPSMSALRSHLSEHRPKVAAALEEAGEGDLASSYLKAPIPDLAINKQFARVLDTVPAGA